MTACSNLSRRTVLFWLLLSSAVSIGWGYWIGYTKHAGFGDFRAVYFAARTAIAHQDPYKPADFLEVYRRDGGEIPTDPVRLHNFERAIPVCVNLPTTLLVVSPLALLSWTPAHLLWMFLMPAGFLLAAWLIWDLAGGAAPRMTLWLLCIVLANCEVLLQLGNASGMSIVLGVVAVWCFVRERHVAAGVVCMALALAIKPQEVGFVWLYIGLAGGELRRRAGYSLALTMGIAVLSVAWISHVSPSWLQEWHANAASTTLHGDLNDPGPTSIGNAKLGMIVSLQAVLSFVRDDPRFYNPVAWLVAGTPILIWGVAALRARPSRQALWLGLGSISALSLLPIYHRQYDAKLLLLAIPAAAMLWEEGSSLRKPALAVTAAGLLFTADIPTGIFYLVSKSMHLRYDETIGKVAGVLLNRTSTLALAAVGMFYLWVFVRSAWPAKVEAREETGGEAGLTQADIPCPITDIL